MRAFLILLFAAAFSIAAALAAADAFAGKWQMNVSKSSYAPGTCLARMVIEMETVNAGIRYHSETTYSNGHTSQSQYIADYDGPEAIVIGTNGLLTPVALKRLAPDIVVASYKRGFQVIATSRREVSSNGRTMTITTTSTDRDGKVVTNIGVYERVANDWAARPSKNASG
jgi:hypothetical protein